jgi:hypothetical protein
VSSLLASAAAARARQAARLVASRRRPDFERGGMRDWRRLPVVRDYLREPTRPATKASPRFLLRQESLLIVYFLSYPFTSTFIRYFSPLHLHLESFLILYFHSHFSTSYYDGRGFA